MVDFKKMLDDFRDSRRFLKISWTYYGLLWRLVESRGGIKYQQEYTTNHKELRGLEDSPEDFRAYLQAMEEFLNEGMDKYIAEEKRIDYE